VIIAYLVVIAATLLTFGRVSDLIGRKPVWVAGLVLFTLGSALCGAAVSLPWLIAARTFQGPGGALLFAPGMAIITDAFPAAERGTDARRADHRAHELALDLLPECAVGRARPAGHVAGARQRPSARWCISRSAGCRRTR
jgi:hypothetical protein